ncbi:hypothetical protein QH494_04655 [Sphingomonas sp. AR_OL41]|uniref:hypothetical protein n=1 Tax=Sphingomonas sp. AR_OL41 TaxID=3042729 RepID=UPI002480282D|nr:hypothetical protein [Sphingomonas sp. AR_OL41]MDH7971463.1 hypothetical protein [Sphingomonas sp. AR_OL41]
MAGVVGLMRSVAVVVVTLGLSGCHRAGEEAYRASVECAANEHALHEFYDQIYDAAMMPPDEASRTVAFNRAALRQGAASGRSGGAVKSDVWGRIAALRMRYGKSGPTFGAEDASTLSQACQKRFGDPAGAYDYPFETNTAGKRF